MPPPRNMPSTEGPANRGPLSRPSRGVLFAGPVAIVLACLANSQPDGHWAFGVLTKKSLRETSVRGRPALRCRRFSGRANLTIGIGCGGNARFSGAATGNAQKSSSVVRSRSAQTVLWSPSTM